MGMAIGRYILFIILGGRFQSEWHPHPHLEDRNVGYQTSDVRLWGFALNTMQNDDRSKLLSRCPPQLSVEGGPSFFKEGKLTGVVWQTTELC